MYPFAEFTGTTQGPYLLYPLNAEISLGTQLCTGTENTITRRADGATRGTHVDDGESMHRTDLLALVSVVVWQICRWPCSGPGDECHQVSLHVTLEIDHQGEEGRCDGEKLRGVYLRVEL